MAKKRISLTLDQDLVDRIDRKVEMDDYANRSRAIETFLDEHLRSEKLDLAVVLCGGSKDDLECMIKVDGKPVLEHTIRHLEESGVEKVILAVGTDHEAITDYFGKGDRFGLDIEYLTEERPLGTAGGLRKLRDMINDTFLLMNGDVLCKVDIDDMTESHRKDQALATMALTTIEDTSPYGVVRLKGSYIIGFTEKPEEGEAPSNLINAGVYMLEPDVIDMLPPEDKQEQINVEDLFEQLAGREKLKGYVYEGEWHDLGS